MPQPSAILDDRRFALAFLPTPVQRLAAIETHVEQSPQIWIKRDDLTGLALGGNKTRKLEFLVHEARVGGYDALITGGAAQSNHCRQTAAAAAVAGMECHLVLGGEAPDVADGNLLLDMLYGAQLHWAGGDRKGEGIPALAETLSSQGKRPYCVPYGGSNITGALGYVHAVLEMDAQFEGHWPTHIVCATSSGGTQAGLLAGLRLLGAPCSVIGIGIDAHNCSTGAYATEVTCLANGVLELLNVSQAIATTDVHIDDRYLGEGYGVVAAVERDAMVLMARQEGILLDPVYTGRAFSGLLALLAEHAFTADDRVLFLHTGGQPALFPYRDVLMSTPA